MGKKETFISDNNVLFEAGKLKIRESDIIFDDYDIIDIIGNGANAIILEAQGKIAKEKVAIKIWLPSGLKNRKKQKRNY